MFQVVENCMLSIQRLVKYSGKSMARMVVPIFSVVAEDGTIYWLYEDRFVALTETGEVDWEYVGLSGNYVSGSAPVIGEDGSIYFSHDGLFSFSPEGQLRWVYPFISYNQSSPAIGNDGTIYVAGNAGLNAFTPGEFEIECFHEFQSQRLTVNWRGWDNLCPGLRGNLICDFNLMAR